MFSDCLLPKVETKFDVLQICLKKSDVWFYNQKSQTCENFTDEECTKSKNRFKDEMSCKLKCVFPYSIVGKILSMFRIFSVSMIRVK